MSYRLGYQANHSNRQSHVSDISSLDLVVDVLIELPPIIT